MENDEVLDILSRKVAGVPEGTSSAESGTESGPVTDSLKRRTEAVVDEAKRRWAKYRSGRYQVMPI